jgi:hypothetical protein
MYCVELQCFAGLVTSAAAAACRQDHTCYKFEAVTPEDLPHIQLPSTPNKQQCRSSSQRQQQQQGAGASAAPCSGHGDAGAVRDRFQRLPKELVSISPAGPLRAH